MAKAAEKNRKTIDLALQGGGSHGAFTWGVLDYFLEQHEIMRLGGICGTSAGAVNGTLLAYGLMKGHEDLARELLQTFWYRVSHDIPFGPFKPAPWDKLFGRGNMDYSPGFLSADFLMRFSSPYQWNPYDQNALRDLLVEMVDFDTLRACTDTKLFVCATNVRRCKVKVFKLPEISVEAVLASACLPFLFKAVNIDGEDYWDGGYMGNPPIFPLIDGTDVPDILIVQINPIVIHKLPQTSVEIHDRINEISFNASLMLEMRRVYGIMKLKERGDDKSNYFKNLYIHLINPQEDIADLNVSSKLNTDWDYLTGMRDLGRKYAEKWLNENYDAIGVRSTCDVKSTYL